MRKAKRASHSLSHGNSWKIKFDLKLEKREEVPKEKYYGKIRILKEV